MSATSIRLVSWNVCDAFTRKFGHLERLKPDVAILQEVRPECLSYAGLSERSIWIGDDGQKGLAIVTYGDWIVTPAPVITPAERWFLPAVLTRGTDRLQVVGVWVDSMGRNLAAPTLAALGSLEGFLRQAPSVLAGDFNQTTSMDANKSAGRKFSSVLKRLDGLGLRSAWHVAHGEQQGQESHPTLYWTWNRERPFHIDFAFGSESLQVTAAKLGSYESYVAGRISDHVPFSVDYEMTALDE